jgi:hypothetical protein
MRGVPLIGYRILKAFLPLCEMTHASKKRYHFGPRLSAFVVFALWSLCRIHRPFMLGPALPALVNSVSAVGQPRSDWLAPARRRDDVKLIPFASERVALL